MSLQALQDYIFISKYARYLPQQGRRETWEEAVDRVVHMHEQHLTMTRDNDSSSSSNNNNTNHAVDIAAELQVCRQAMYQKQVLGSQRALQFGGAPILNKHARLYNCTASYCNRPRFFQEALWLLLCGCGVGFSVQKHHVACLPSLVEPSNNSNSNNNNNENNPVNDDTINEAVYVIEDSIEGWANALGVLMASFGIVASEWNEEWRGQAVQFDFSRIRPQGAPLASSGGKAPGPEPLRNSLRKIAALLRRCLAQNPDRRLRPIDAYDIVMHASDAVLAGGVRRSATLCLFSVDDQEMLEAKTGNWFMDNPQRARSNNSAVLLRDKTTRAQFDQLFSAVQQFGEPGLFFSSSTEICYNPCGEIGLYPVIDGQSGWAFCNLCEINGKACETVADWKRACTAAAYLGTIQATYTRFEYLGDVSERIAQREALLGVSMTGILDQPDLLLNPTLQREMAQHVRSVNEQFAAKLGIAPAARATCVKPAGTTSCLLGTSSGIHPHHASRYFRRVQAGAFEAPLHYFASTNPQHVEPSVWSCSSSTNKPDQVITFCVEAADHALTKQSVGAIDLLRHVQTTQEHWVDGGRNVARCAAPFLRHNVSNTIHVRHHEWKEVADYIYSHRQSFAGVALLPFEGDRVYNQAPFVEILSLDEIKKEYGNDASMAAVALLKDALDIFGGQNIWSACDAALGRVGSLTPDDQAKLDWVKRVKEAADVHLDGDVNRLTYLIKDVHHSHHWCCLQKSFQPLDWTHFYEKEDGTERPILDAACGGGKCDLILPSGASLQTLEPLVESQSIKA